MFGNRVEGLALTLPAAVFAAAARMAQAGDRSPFFVAVVFPAVLFAVVHPPAAWIPILFLGLAGSRTPFCAHLLLIQRGRSFFLSICEN